MFDDSFCCHNEIIFCDITIWSSSISSLWRKNALSSPKDTECFKNRVDSGERTTLIIGTYCLSSYAVSRLLQILIEMNCKDTQLTISAEFWSYSAILPLHYSEEMKILNISLPRLVGNWTTCRVYRHTLVPLRHDWPKNTYINIFLYNN